jgi:hypothetical protein
MFQNFTCQTVFLVYLELPWLLEQVNVTPIMFVGILETVPTKYPPLFLCRIIVTIFRKLTQFRIATYLGGNIFCVRFYGFITDYKSLLLKILDQGNIRIHGITSFGLIDGLVLIHYRFLWCSRCNFKCIITSKET